MNKELADAFTKPSKRMTASAYEQQKSKVNPRLFKAILYEFNSTLKQPALYHGYRLLAIDGSDFALPYDKNSMLISQDFTTQAQRLTDFLPAVFLFMHDFPETRGSQL